MVYNNIFKKSNTSNKYTNKSFHELLEAFKKEGCPICSIVDFSIDNYFENTLYEFVNDPKVRRDLRESLGYCQKHSAQLKRVVEKSYQKLGACIIIEDVIKELIKKFSEFLKLPLKQLKNIDIESHKCPACIYQSRYENIYYLEILNNLENENFLIFSLVYLFFGLINNSLFIWLLFPVYGIYMALTEGVGKAYISLLVPQEKSGTAFGIYQTSIGICSFLSSLIAGVMWSYINVRVPFFFGSITAFISVILFIGLGKKVKIIK